MRTITTLQRHSNRGFTLIELMVAMVLGLIALGAVGLVFVNSNKNYNTQESLARLQENARLATQILTRDLRQAGYFGCLDDTNSVHNRLDAGSSLLGNIPIEGYEQGDTTWHPGGSTDLITEMVAGTDGVAVRFLEPGTGGDVEEPFMPRVSAALHLQPNNGLIMGDIVATTDCASGEIFQITGPSQTNVDNGILNHNTGSSVVPGNADQNFSKTYDDDATVMKFGAWRYFIKDDGNGPGLFRESLLNNGGTIITDAFEFVPGIENLQVMYGEDTNSDFIPDTYVDADVVGNWENVISVRIGILARSIANTRYDTEGEYGNQFDVDTRSYDLDGDGVNEVNPPDERVIRQAFVSTIALRNRQQ
ncbi:MAG: PilW family protein [Gammaproteobacteria bacterium]|nr:PilW family protein [Gammaproteobacteria bacterium]MDH3468557.1 PilW family protein [Gammaproteobacteria bacterium]